MINMSLPGTPGMWARFSATTTQSISSGTSVAAGNKLAFQRVEKSDSWPAVSVPVSDIVIPVTGLYLILFHDLDWQDSGSGAGSRRIFRRISDSGLSSRSGGIAAPTLAASSIQTVQSYPEMRPFTAGSTVQFHAVQNSGSTLSTVAVNDVGFYLLQPLASNPYADSDS